jgi:hypothetical protein
MCMIAIVFSTVGRNGVMGALSLRIFAIHGSTSCVREKNTPNLDRLRMCSGIGLLSGRRLGKKITSR